MAEANDSAVVDAVAGFVFAASAKRACPDGLLVETCRIPDRAFQALIFPYLAPMSQVVESHEYGNRDSRASVEVHPSKCTLGASMFLFRQCLWTRATKSFAMRSTTRGSAVSFPPDAI